MKAINITIVLMIFVLVIPLTMAKQIRKAKNDASAVIMTIDGKPVITKDRLQKVIDELVEAQPQYKVMLQAMNQKELEKNIVDGLAKQAIIDHYAQVNKLADTKEYQVKMARVLELATQMVNAEFFTKNIKVIVSDKEVRAFYEKNKDTMPQLRMSRDAYRPFEEIRDDLKAFLEKEKLQECINREVEKLRKIYKVQINEDYLTA